MRVLHVAKYYPPAVGGMERFLGDLADAQRAAGAEVAVLAHAHGRAAVDGDPPWVLRCPVWFRFVFAPVSPAFPLWLRRAIRSFAPRVLHLHLPNVSALWALLLPSARALPWVVHWHSDVEPSRFRLGLRLAYPFYRIFEHVLLERADVIVATSAPYLESSRALAPWHDKCTVIPLGLDPRRLGEVAEADRAGLWQPGHVHLLAIGRLTYYKGFDTLIRAVSALRGMELVVVGEGEERPVLEAALNECGRPSHIRLLGQLDDAACNRLLASCDLFCLPSRERTEAFGIVLMEAMRYGKPLVTSRIPGSGVTWVVEDGRNGRLIAPDDVVAWREALVALAADGTLRARLGDEGRRRFERQFGIGECADRLARLYASIADPEPEVSAANRGPLVVIPALNEAKTIGAVIRAVRAQGFQDVVVVDDGSRDDTASVAAAAGARVLTPPLPQGAWGAMQTGIRYAVRNGYAAVITMDADGQHEPVYLPQLVEAAREADVVIGACPRRGSRLRHVAWAYFRGLTGFRFEDLTSGFRYYNAAACAQLADEEAVMLDYQDVGVLLLLHKAGFRVREIPVAMNPRQIGASRVFDSWLTVGRYMLETTLLCMARWKVKAPRP